VPKLDQEPPHNLEAEEAVLGAALAAGRLLAEVAALVEEADFYRPAHRAIWRAMLRLADRGQPTDPVTVLGELEHAGELADIGGAPSCTPSSRPCPRWPMPATTPAWSPTRPGAGG
jgi:replicative DNA helicase